LSLIVDEHRQYLSDHARISAFREAIREVIRPGDVVLDLGAGTGILGLLACQAGAKRVYSIDEGAMIELAREICRANGFGEQMVFVKGLSTRVELPERVDVVVADQIGRFGFEAGLMDYFTDARKRFLKPDGITVPSRVDLCVAPVEVPELWNQVEFWNNSDVGFNLRPARVMAANTGYPVKLSAEQLLGSPASVASLELSEEGHEVLDFETSIAATRNGSLHGIGGWFSAQLSSNVTMSNSPLDARRINRMNVFFPIDRPVALTRGDLVRIKMRILPGDLMVQWIVEVCGCSENHHEPRTVTRKARFAHSTLQGMLISNEDLRKTQPHFVPKLSPWGEARRLVVNLCDGRRTLEEIEQEVYRSHPQLFPSQGKAAAFVAEVVTRYAL
jgi:protein arginine N-methyltransferase 1